MGLNEKNLSYHGPVKDIKEVMRLAKAFPASIDSNGNNSIYLNIEMGYKTLNIYPQKGNKIGESIYRLKDYQGFFLVQVRFHFQQKKNFQQKKKKVILFIMTLKMEGFD